MEQTTVVPEQQHNVTENIGRDQEPGGEEAEVVERVVETGGEATGGNGAFEGLSTSSTGSTTTKKTLGTRMKGKVSSKNAITSEIDDIRNFWRSQYDIHNHNFEQPRHDIYSFFRTTKYFSGQSYNEFVFKSTVIQDLVCLNRVPSLGKV